MKLKVISPEGKEDGSVTLPTQFSEEVRSDLIKRAVLAIQSHNRQPYGASPEAGKRASAKLSRRRRNYRGSYGLGISRVPRKIFSRRGTRMNWQGAFAPGTVGGRRAHPPKAEKIWWQELNKKERAKAIRSAIAASIKGNSINERTIKAPETFPFILSGQWEDIQKTKELSQSLTQLGFERVMERASEKKVRAGKGKGRGRKYAKKKGVLFVVSKECSLMRAAHNLPGSDAALVQNLNAEILAPGGDPGRITFWSKPAIERLGKENLFGGE